MDKTKLQKATLAIARQLAKLDESTLEAITENEELISTIINDNLGSQLRREALLADSDISHTLDEDEVQFAIQDARDGNFEAMGQLSRTELERNLAEMNRRYRNACYDIDDCERRYRRATFSN